jgi:hypothetical protein
MGRYRPGQTCLLGIGLYEKELTGLKVGAHLDGKLGVSLEPAYVTHDGNDIPTAI